MRSGLLSDADAALLQDERQLLAELREALVKLDASPENRLALAKSIEQLDELFLLVVAGEFNSGKSAFINALVGETILKEGVTPTTAQIHVLRYGDERDVQVLSPDVHLVSAPIDLLRDLHIVDTPGTNAVIREHEAITADFIPRSDLVLFVTSADRPFTESERLFLAGIRDWGKKVIVVINKIDLFEREEEVREVIAFVEHHARTLLGVAPEVFAVSARLALRAKRGEPGLWARSRFEALERFVRERLDQGERLRLKMSNPLGVGLSLASRYRAVVVDRLELLQDDLKLLDDIGRQQAVTTEDLKRQFELRMTSIENILLEMEQRGHRYFDDMFRLGRVFDLFNTARIREGFEREVVADAPRQIETRVSELIDWLVSADIKQWHAVSQRLTERRQQYRDRIIGDAEVASFHSERTQLISSVGREAQKVVESYDRRREAAELAEKARVAVATAAAVGAGALGLGAVVTAVASTAAADLTGILMASVLAAIGFFVIPARRRAAKAEMHEKVTRMRQTLSQAMRDQFTSEIARSGERMEASIAPYSRFVRAEQDALTTSRDRLDGLAGRMTMLRDRLAAKSAAGIGVDRPA
jgi:small GTP-binding protein